MRSLRLAALTGALLVVPAAAWAHPNLNPNALPVGEPVETVLVVPHGCSTGAGVMPEEGEAVPTTRLDLELVDGVTVEPGDVDGWDVVDDGEAIVWTDAGGATTDPIQLPLTVTVTQGRAGDELAMSAYQECEDGSSYRWTEGSDATPPVRLELVEGEAGTVEMEGMEHDEGASEEAHEAASDQVTGEDDVRALAVDRDGDGGTSTLLVVVLVVLVVLVAGGLVLRARKGSA